MGNLTRDPELRYTPKGMAVVKITLALNYSWKAESGEEREEVTFIDVTFFGKQAEVIGQYMRKGRQLAVTGRLKMESWEDKQSGAKRSKITVMGDSLYFTQGKRDDDQEQRPAAPRPATRAAAPAPVEDDMPPQESDDVPF
jgi:single-strand DNA-binding protein